MSVELRQQMVQKVKNIFSENRPQDAKNMNYVSDHGVGFLIKKRFEAKSWNSISLETLIEFRNELADFTHEGFHYYFPAFLIAVLEHPQETDTLIDSIVFYLSPPLPAINPNITEQKKANFQNRTQLFNVQERAVILEFLTKYSELFSDQNPDLEDDEIDRINRAIAYWKRFV